MARASQVELLGRFAGEQVARGGRAGLPGTVDIMKLPFAGTAYTQTLIQNRQARSTAQSAHATGAAGLCRALR